MILFREEHVAPILNGEKTQARRLWAKPRVRVGSVHKAYTRPPFARNGAAPSPACASQPCARNGSRA